MIIGKLWRALRAQVNKMANWFWQRDPIAQMQYEYDRSVEQLKEGREGLEQYRGLVERVQRQVGVGEDLIRKLTARIKAHLSAGDRDAAGRLAVELKRAQDELAENRGQLVLHEQAYQNNLIKIKHAAKKLSEVRDKIQKYDAELKMSAAEAEVAKLSKSFNFDVTTDFGQIERVIQDRIDLERGKVRVAADMSQEGVEEIKAEERAEKVQAEDLLKQFEVDMGLRTPETANIPKNVQELGPTREKKDTQ